MNCILLSSMQLLTIVNKSEKNINPFFKDFFFKYTDCSIV